ncbi:MAG: hypothetical protein U0794_09450 [Isosphaeraceae bacterium]
MRKFTTMAVALMISLGVLAGLSQARSPEETIKKAMKAAMKGGLCKKVAEGKATDAQKEELAKLFSDMCKATPPKGDAASWNEKAGALAAAAKAAAEGKPGAAAQLKKAANCKSCHDAHKGE